MDKRQELDIDNMNTVFRQCAPAVYSYVLRLTNSSGDAEEVVQETFLKVWENRTALPDVRNIQVYVNTIARNIVYNMFKQRLVRRQYGEHLKISLDHVSFERQLHLNDLKKTMHEEIGKLPAQQRAILMLKSKGFSNEEISQLLDISKRTVEAHLNKAYKSLRSQFGDIDDFLPLITIIIGGL